MLEDSLLGKETTYTHFYTPELLFPISRALGRDKIGLKEENLPFHGVDIWNGFELSWLNEKGKPQVALAQFIFPCNSSVIIESKSFKLYLNSFNQTKFASFEEVQKTLAKDLSLAIKKEVEVLLFSLKETFQIAPFEGECLDDLDIETSTYTVTPSFLTVERKEMIEEELYTDLLKSNCLATGQPDWGSLYIHYKGPKIDKKGLLKYVISYRNHSGFGEHCVEQMFCDLLKKCTPEKLTIYARYTRRGGLDINPFRSNFENFKNNRRNERQ